MILISLSRKPVDHSSCIKKKLLSIPLACTVSATRVFKNLLVFYLISASHEVRQNKYMVFMNNSNLRVLTEIIMNFTTAFLDSWKKLRPS